MPEPPLQPTSAIRRVTAFALVFALAGSLACYQDKPAASVNSAAAANTPAAATAAPTTSAPASQDPAALGLQPVPATHDTALREVDAYALTTERLQQWAAAQRNLNELNVRDPDVTKRLKGSAPPKTLREMAQRIDGEPAVKGALKQAGINGHDYVLTMVALQTALQGFQVKQMGKLSPSRVPPVVLANIDFVGSHLQDVMRAMGIARGGAPPR